MRVGVIGVGAIGSRHVAHLRSAGHRVVTVDNGKDAQYSDLADVPDPDGLGAWIISTPTAAHLRTVERLLDVQPSARIVLEKPACSPAELPRLIDVVSAHDRARVLVNDVYSRSSAVHRFARSVRELRRGEPIKKITIEFSKNREEDVVNGRAVDTDYGDVGYEWFHMLSVLRAILPPEQYDRYLGVEPLPATPDLSVFTTGHGLPDIELFTSVRGRIGFARSARFAFTSADARRIIDSGVIPYGCDLRYRFADVEFVSGRRATLVFEPFHGTSPDHKNEHVIHLRGGSVDQSSVISGNQLEDALLRQLEALADAPPGVALLRLPEHEHMARLSANTRSHRTHLRLASVGTPRV